MCLAHLPLRAEIHTTHVRDATALKLNFYYVSTVPLVSNSCSSQQSTIEKKLSQAILHN